ncbi:hypothetical protein P43SY_007636 [Pythium insidiosum]|uniref:FYVE-type domain-containing protein n=1 Tax=Pythium insidiosum TaxID=114742 RepID=A0AAD5LFV5_PYTIN|nr:hypothetical protein P43SY_007636 [Pythium insidiosum]
MATSLPLPKGFFDTNVRLSDERRRHYIEFAESSIRKVFALSDCQKNSWIPVREKKGVAVYRNFGGSRGPKAYKSNIAEVTGKAELPATLEEIGRAYAAHDDALFRRLMKKLNAGVLDAAVLFTVVPRTPLTPFRYIGVKWFAVKTPTPLVSHRDYCCLEVQDKIRDAYGNEMFIRILNSIEVHECPSLENSHGLVRAKMLAGFMYRADRAEPGVVRIHHVARFDPAGYFPSQWSYKTAESQLVSSIVQIKRIIEKQQMNACTFVDRKQWVPNHERVHCAVCSRAFGTFRPRHHCRCCGEVICGKCSVFKNVDVPGTNIKSVRICSICNMGVQRSAGQQHEDTMSDVSASSVTSSSTVAHNEMNMMDLYLSASGNPGTPSAYSSASTQSNISIRSTASSRSVIDARGRAATLNSTTSTRFFRGNGPAQHTPQSIYAAPTSAGASAARTRPRSGSSLHAGLFTDSSNTPRSYIANNLTPRGGFGMTTATTTPRSRAPSAATQTPSAQDERMSVFKQNPLDLTYLRDSIRATSSKMPQSHSTASTSGEYTPTPTPPTSAAAEGPAGTQDTHVETPSEAAADADDAEMKAEPTISTAWPRPSLEDPHSGRPQGSNQEEHADASKELSRPAAHSDSADSSVSEMAVAVAPLDVPTDVSKRVSLSGSVSDNNNAPSNRVSTSTRPSRASTAASPALAAASSPEMPRRSSFFGGLLARVSSFGSSAA